MFNLFSLYFDCFLFLHVSYYRFSLFTVIKRDPDVKTIAIGSTLN